ncbi:MULTISPECIES: hypothetical protein [unclassified Spirosoma]|uniref:hypothetical protein n=1 Tax=unclassified Spirosoma TaxID=2621999 RepID=UPI0009610039|nr:MULTISPECIES: hypothetical protein [unclassified Spirosoma]MBN8823830.1 hypothetical protein [Spirosoma sp.]OJW79776.1 MAG: hypothetical protein BGO59_00550 [Spirosoma sp. 48-14]
MKAISILFFVGAVLIGTSSFRVQNPKTTTDSVVNLDTLKIDAESGLVADANLMMVKAQCTACHSSKLILQHRFTRAGWQERIRWMQKYHKLWDLGESEKVVLDYLEKYYGPSSMESKATFRRAPLKDIQWYKLNE